MKNILIMGAGQSSPYLIRHLLDEAARSDWFVTVGDLDLAAVRQRIDGHPRGDAIALDINDTAMRSRLIQNADVVVNLLPPAFQPLVAWDCVQHSTHMVSASYRDNRIRDLELDARRNGVLILTEVGLDPGIDLMSAMTIIQDVRDRGGIVQSFESYGSGVPAPESKVNPLRYCITWNPRNVVMSGEHGAQYLQEGKIKIVPWHHVFQRSWPIEVEGVGTMEGYPNRDSLSYQQVFGLTHVETMIRGTLRYPGWSETWLQVVRLGLPNEHIRIPDLHRRSYREIVEMFLPRSSVGSTVEARVAHYLQISPTGRIMENLSWLGLFSPAPIGIEGETAADAMIHLLKTRLALPPDVCDCVIIAHDLTVCYPAEGNRRERITSTFVHRGEPGGPTAMATTVGLPTAIAASLVMRGELPLTGCHIPTHQTIYEPILSELKKKGLQFVHRVRPIE